MAEALRGRRAEIEETIFHHLRHAVPDDLGDLDFEYVAGLHAAVAATVNYTIAGIEHGEERCGSAPLAAIVQARRAALAGVGLDTVLLRYVAGHTLLEDFVMDAVEAVNASDGALLRQLRRIQAALLGRLTAEIADAHREELELAKSSSGQRRTELVRRLLIGERVDTAELGYALDVWHLGVIAFGSAAERVLGGLAAELGHQPLLVSGGENVAWAWFSGRRKSAAEELVGLLEARRRNHVSLAIGEPGDGVRGFRLTHRQAQSALQVAVRRPQWLTRYADVALLAFALRDEALARSLVDVYLAPLDDMQIGGRVARETLLAYFAAGHCVKATASQLKVDRRTVWYRLDKITQRLGWAPKERRAEFEVALRLEKLAVGERTAGAGESQRWSPLAEDHDELADARLQQFQ